MAARFHPSKTTMIMTALEDFFAEEERQLEAATVTYIVQVGSRVVVVENVPARVNSVTGEQLFSAATTERLLQITQGQLAEPVRYAETPVYSFAA